MRRIFGNLTALICLVVLSIPAHATLAGYNSCEGANACLVAPDEAPIPDPIVANPNDGVLLGWDEKQNVTLTENLYVNRVADPDAVFIGMDSAGVFIEAGTVVSSHYFQWDPGNGSNSRVTSQLNFDSEIFAFITSDTNLFGSDDPLGLDGFDYADFGLRGLESGDTTDFAPGGDDSLVDISWSASSPGDWTRLITAFSPGGGDPDEPLPPVASVTEPATLMLLALALVGLTIRSLLARRRHHK